MSDRVTTAEAVAGELADGMTIGIGGWGSRRKPMTLVRAILRSPVRGLTVVSFGGPDVGLLCAAGKVERVVYGFVSLDSIPLEPSFRRARQEGAVAAFELDEGMMVVGLEAAARRLPFAVTRAGLGSDVLANHPELRTITCPYTGEELVCVPALELDVALVHVNRADARGNGQILGPDPFFDDLFCRAARRRFASCEQIVATGELADGGCPHTLVLDRTMVDGVVEAPGGAGFTACPPDYERDEERQAGYARAAADPQRWNEFYERYLAEGPA